jgi:anti-sigma-K factor RskA
LWLIDGSGAHAVRLLDKAADHEVRRVVTVDGQATQWAVTVEPDGGVDQPTSAIIFSGAV